MRNIVINWLYFINILKSHLETMAGQDKTVGTTEMMIDADIYFRSVNISTIDYFVRRLGLNTRRLNE